MQKKASSEALDGVNSPVAEASKTEDKNMNGCMCVKTLDPNPEP